LGGGGFWGGGVRGYVGLIWFGGWREGRGGWVRVGWGGSCGVDGFVGFRSQNETRADGRNIECRIS